MTMAMVSRATAGIGALVLAGLVAAGVVVLRRRAGGGSPPGP
jgi:hypothetical protein